MSFKITTTVLRIALPLATLFAGSLSLRADERDDAIRLLREQINLLDQKLRVLERKSEIKDEEAATAAKIAPKITVNDKGITLASADGANSIKLRGLVQFDSRLFFGDNGLVNNSFILRRARIISEGTFAKIYSFQVVPELGGSTISLLDANVTIALSNAFQIKAGKFKVPVGYEQLQSDSWTFFNERSLASNLVPNRDVGIQVGGELAGGTVSYAAGVFGGVSDGGSSANADFDNDKDVAGRIFFSPAKNQADSFFSGLGFGVGASLGREKTAAGLTSGYRTAGQQTFFRYRSTAVSDGQVWRVSPQVDFRRGSFGLLGEYVLSVVNPRSAVGLPKTELTNKAWEIAAGYVLTGEDSAYAGVVPKSNFDPSAGSWGAFEVVARFDRLTIDSAAYPLFADPAASARQASTIGAGLNWYLSKAVRASLDYYQTTFDTGLLAPTAALLRQDEQALITRLQVAF
jgi:phosphate-selective porin OprO/OprP